MLPEIKAGSTGKRRLCCTVYSRLRTHFGCFKKVLSEPMEHVIHQTIGGHTQMSTKLRLKSSNFKAEMFFRN